MTGETHTPRPEAPERIYLRYFPGIGNWAGSKIHVDDTVEYIRADALRPAASEGEGVEGWSAMDTAPRDGSHFVAAYLDDCGLHTPYWHIATITWDGKKFSHCDPLADDKIIPHYKHWVPQFAAPKPPQSPSLALAEESRVLREKLLARATVYEDEYLCEPAKAGAGTDIPALLREASAALSAAHPSAQAYSEAFDGLVKTARELLGFVRIKYGNTDPDANEACARAESYFAKAESCK